MWHMHRKLDTRGEMRGLNACQRAWTPSYGEVGRAHNTRPSVIDRTRFGCKRNYVCQRRCFLSFVKGTVHVAQEIERKILSGRESPGTLMTDRLCLSLSLSLFRVLPAHRLSLGGSESVSFVPDAEAYRIFDRDSAHISWCTRQRKNAHVLSLSK